MAKDEFKNLGFGEDDKKGAGGAPAEAKKDEEQHKGELRW